MVAVKVGTDPKQNEEIFWSDSNVLYLGRGSFIYQNSSGEKHSLTHMIHLKCVHFVIHHINKLKNKNHIIGGFPGGAVVENLPANAGDTGSSPGLGRSHMPRSN